jgi:hypothetical protein
MAWLPVVPATTGALAPTVALSKGSSTHTSTGSSGSSSSSSSSSSGGGGGSSSSDRWGSHGCAVRQLCAAPQQPCWPTLGAGSLAETLQPCLTTTQPPHQSHCTYHKAATLLPALPAWSHSSFSGKIISVCAEHWQSAGSGGLPAVTAAPAVPRATALPHLGLLLSLPGAAGAPELALCDLAAAGCLPVGSAVHRPLDLGPAIFVINSGSCGHSSSSSCGSLVTQPQGHAAGNMVCPLEWLQLVAGACCGGSSGCTPAAPPVPPFVLLPALADLGQKWPPGHADGAAICSTGLPEPSLLSAEASSIALALAAHGGWAALQLQQHQHPACMCTGCLTGGACCLLTI